MKLSLLLSRCLQVASAQAELAQKTLLVPAAPSSLNASLSLGAIGVMVSLENPPFRLLGTSSEALVYKALASPLCYTYGLSSALFFPIMGEAVIQVWISPWQVAHVLSIARTLQADLAPAWRPAAARTKGRKRSRSKLSYMSSSHLHVACTLHIPLISSIIMVSQLSTMPLIVSQLLWQIDTHEPF